MPSPFRSSSRERLHLSEHDAAPEKPHSHLERKYVSCSVLHRSVELTFKLFYSVVFDHHLSNATAVGGPIYSKRIRWTSDTARCCVGAFFIYFNTRLRLHIPNAPRSCLATSIYRRPIPPQVVGPCLAMVSITICRRPSFFLLLEGAYAFLAYR